jgi:hypothetical protein
MHDKIEEVYYYEEMLFFLASEILGKLCSIIKTIQKNLPCLLEGVITQIFHHPYFVHTALCPFASLSL